MQKVECRGELRVESMGPPRWSHTIPTLQMTLRKTTCHPQAPFSLHSWRAIYPFPTKNHGLKHEGSHPHSSHSHSAANSPCAGWRSWTDEAKSTKSSATRCNSEVPHTDTLLTPAVHEYDKQDLEQWATLAESDTHWKYVWLCVKNAKTALTSIV